jgi:hypothetical protein
MEILFHCKTGKGDELPLPETSIPAESGSATGIKFACLRQSRRGGMGKAFTPESGHKLFR